MIISSIGKFVKVKKLDKLGGMRDDMGSLLQVPGPQRAPFPFWRAQAFTA